MDLEKEICSLDLRKYLSGLGFDRHSYRIWCDSNGAIHVDLTYYPALVEQLCERERAEEMSEKLFDEQDRG